jgi:hypothetical protein
MLIILCFIDFRLRTRKRNKLLAWFREVLPTGHRVRDLTAVWQDGTILCEIIESVVPGSCPEELRKHQSHKSIQHGQLLAKRHLSVQPVSAFRLIKGSCNTKSSVSQNFTRRPLLAEKNNFGSPYSCSRKYSPDDRYPK